MNLPGIVVVSLVVLIGCNPQRNLRRMGDNFANAVGRGPAPVKVDLAVLADVAIDATAAQAKGKARQQIANATAERPPAPEPIQVHDNRTQTVQPTPTPEPVRVDHTRTVDTSGDVIWKNFRRDGEKPRCEKYAGEVSACSGECAELLRVEGMRQLDPRAGKPLTCSCTQGYSHCK
jgi:hypothetical protein